MLKTHYFVKVENDISSFVFNGEFSIEVSRVPQSVREEDIPYIVAELEKTVPDVMCRGNKEVLSIHSTIHRISEISNAKPAANFIVMHITVDWGMPKTEVLEVWHFDVKQYPDGYVNFHKEKMNVES